MSGGIDSSVAAGLLQRSDRPVVGMTMQLWNQRRMPELIPPGGASGRCCSLDDVYDARSVAQHLGIPFYVVDYQDAFEREVVRPFVSDYRAGRTPIPCTHCNTFIKFEKFLQTARQVGADTVATGHYARVAEDAASGRCLLLRGADETRDQSYFLFGLTQRQLRHTVFPLGAMRKDEVRRLAGRMGLPVAGKAESREICFVPDGDYARFVEAYSDQQRDEPVNDSGEVVTESGRVLGEHRGIHRFTVGQRRGLGVAVGKPIYVTKIEPASNRVVVGPAEALLRDRFEIRDANWIRFPSLERPARIAVRIRYRAPPAPAVVRPSVRSPDRAEVLLDRPLRAVTPGQAAVCYDGDVVVGGGWIV